MKHKNTMEAIHLIVNTFFAGFKALVGKPVLTEKPGKIVVQIPYFLPSSATTPDFNKLAVAVSHSGMSGYATNASQVEVKLIRLRYPYSDNVILSQYLATNAGKYNFLRMKKMLFDKIHCEISPNSTSLPSHLSGVKMELAGRLTTQRSIPRKTVANVHKGSLQASSHGQGGKAKFSNPNALKTNNLSQYVSKNRLGAYTMKV